MPDEKGRLWPGDVGYKGGTTTTRAYYKGKAVEVTTKKDPNGNVQAVFIRDLWLGIF